MVHLTSAYWRSTRRTSRCSSRHCASAIDGRVASSLRTSSYASLANLYFHGCNEYYMGSIVLASSPAAAQQNILHITQMRGNQEGGPLVLSYIYRPAQILLADLWVRSKHALGAGHVGATSPLDCLADGQRQGFESRFGSAHLCQPNGPRLDELVVSSPVVIVLSTKDVDMKSDASSYRERVENVREHLRREITDLFSLEAKVGDAIWSRADVYHRS